MEAQLQKFRELGAGAAIVDQLKQRVQDTQQRMNEQLDRLSEQHQLTRAELDQIIAEGDQQGWGGTRKK